MKTKAGVPLFVEECRAIVGSDRWAVVILPSGCHEWQRYRTPEGYGTTSVRGTSRLVHRVAYVAANGPIPEGLTIDHLCRNTSCVNPEHLDAVTAEENAARSGAARTHCVNGHPFDEGNTYNWRGLQRKCRRCHAAREAAYRDRTKPGAVQ